MWRVLQFAAVWMNSSEMSKLAKALEWHVLVSSKKTLVFPLIRYWQCLSWDDPPLTAPPGPVTDLKTTANTSTSVTLEWTRPEVTGRDDFYYTYQIFDPDRILRDTAVRLPYTASSPKITFQVTSLRPVTPFTFRITTHNGVSDEDKENAALRKVELVVKTREDGK